MGEHTPGDKRGHLRGEEVVDERLHLRDEGDQGGGWRRGGRRRDRAVHQLGEQLRIFAFLTRSPIRLRGHGLDLGGIGGRSGKRQVGKEHQGE